jgi:hypothetical protein
MKYTVVVADSIEDLEGYVEGHAKDGWKPLGGIAIRAVTETNERKGYDETYTTYYQAMVKEAA